MATLSIEEEYWTVQYLTNVLGHREPIFWPPDGEGKFSSEQVATDVAGRKTQDYPAARVVHVVRSMRYGQPVTAESLLDASSRER